ncbi:hypothetical protein MPSEU_000906700 [Mayamaea pseudoterrestris]|nr:hypothetical protein MPSEU_000906700 [Mayamaea pseudoterrestris]
MSEVDGCNNSSSNARNNRLSWSQSIEGKYNLSGGCSQTNQSSNSQQDYQPHHQSQLSDILTQTAELTQLGDCEEDSVALSPLPPFSPSAQRKIPWGRLMPCSSDSAKAIDLYPREPLDRDNNHQQQHTTAATASNTPGVFFLGLSDIHPSQIFNVYTLGRSSKADVPAIAPCADEQDPVRKASLQWAFGMISNKHCRIYSQFVAPMYMEVYIEDTSGNGTLINQTTLLLKGEKRLLHSGDEICLVNPATLRKKIRHAGALNEILREHTYIFVNLLVQQQQSAFGAAVIRRGVANSHAATNARHSMGPPASSSKRRAAVDPRAIKPHGGRLLPGAPPFSANGSPSRATTSASATSSAPSVRRVELDYDIRDLLGTGTVGTVRRAIDRKTGIERAVKIISLQRQSMNGGSSNNNNTDNSTAIFQAEAAILQGLDHPYIVKLIAYYISPSNVHLVFELCVGGDLFDRIVRKTKYSESDARKVMRRLLAAIYYLHETKQVAHRDLKPENILLSSKESDIDIQLTDFGLAKTVSNEGLKTFCGTPMYFAPEILQRRHTIMGKGRYGKEADIWSLGIILYILLSGVPPFDPDSHRDLVIEFPHEFWACVSKPAQDLVRKLLVVDPKLRFTVSQACLHEWILEEDGDTHCNPLDDPRLVSTTQKRLFLDGIDHHDDAADTFDDGNVGLPIDGEDDGDNASMSKRIVDKKCVNIDQASARHSKETAAVVSTELSTSKHLVGENASDDVADQADMASKEFTDEDIANDDDVPNETDAPTETNDKLASENDQTPEKVTKVPKVSLGGNASDISDMYSPECSEAHSIRAPLEPIFPVPIKKSSTSKSMGNPPHASSLTSQALTVAAYALSTNHMGELVEDDIMSNFSEKTESVSSFGDVQHASDESFNKITMPPLSALATVEKTAAKKIKMAQPDTKIATKKRRTVAAKPTESTHNDSKTIKTRKAPGKKAAIGSPSKQATKKKTSTATSNDENGRQTTLSSFFAKRN